MLVSSYSSSDVEMISVETPYQGYLSIRLCRFRYRLFEGGWSDVVERELLVRGDTVAVLLYDPEKDAVVLVEQIRIGARDDAVSPWQFELVAGVVEQEENAVDVAVRETQEEAGVSIVNPRLLFRYYSTPGIADETTSLFYAELDSDLASGIHGLKEENEDIKVHVLSRQEALSMCYEGRFSNAHVILGLHWLELSLR